MIGGLPSNQYGTPGWHAITEKSAKWGDWDVCVAFDRSWLVAFRVWFMGVDIGVSAFDYSKYGGVALSRDNVLDMQWPLHRGRCKVDGALRLRRCDKPSEQAESLV